MWKTKRALSADVHRWREAGWVTPEGADAILAELAIRRGPGAAVALGTLGAILFGFAAMSFVAANWDAIPRVARLLLLTGATGAAYAASAVLFTRGLDGFGHAAALAGAILFGVDIMLISQMYHIDGNPPDAALVWALGALATGVLVGSRPVLALSLALMCLWGAWETVQFNSYLAKPAVFWPFLPGLAVVATAMAWQNWPRGLHMCAVALSAFTIATGYQLGFKNSHYLVAAIGIAVAAGGLLAEASRDRTDARRHAPAWLLEATVYGVAIAAAALFAGQFDSGLKDGWFGFGAALALAFSIAVIWMGVTLNRIHLKRLGYLLFAIETVTIYFKTVGTLLGSSAFFLTAGLLLIGLAVIAMRLQRSDGPRMTSTRDAAP